MCEFIAAQGQYCFITNRARLLISLEQGHILSGEKTGNKGHARQGGDLDPAAANHRCRATFSGAGPLFLRSLSARTHAHSDA